jgi:hypothetical protein
LWFRKFGIRFALLFNKLSPEKLLQVLDINITFNREGRAGNRIIRMHATTENTVSIVSSIGNNGAGLAKLRRRPLHEDNAQSGLMSLMGTYSPGHGSVRPQTMLTLLTQTLAFVLGNRSEDYGHPYGPGGPSTAGGMQPLGCMRC